MSSPASRANAVMYHAFHGANCPRVVAMKLNPCSDHDGLSPSRKEGWPAEWATDPDVLAEFPGFALFAGRTCLQTWRLKEQLAERN